MIIIHRDLKTSNVLSDQNMNPQVSFFGMAWIFKENDTSNYKQDWWNIISKYLLNPGCGWYEVAMLYKAFMILLYSKYLTIMHRGVSCLLCMT